MKIDAQTRYLLARPRGGFNDTLVRLEAVRRYAMRTKRVLVVDMSRSGLHCAFDDLFTVRDGFGCDVVVWNPQIGRELDEFTSVHPGPLAGRTSVYTPEHQLDSGQYFDSETNVEIGFDFKSDYPEQLLIYEQEGGGLTAINVLRHLAFKTQIANAIVKRLIALGPDYDAMHIRHSDYKTDYQILLDRAASLFAGRRLLVCSDSAQVKAKAEASLKGKVDVVSIAEIPDTGGVPLHETKDIDRAAANIDLLTEIVAMARAKRFVFTQLAKDGNLGWPFSGFALLAEALRADPETVKTLFVNADGNLVEKFFDMARQSRARGSISQTITRNFAAIDAYRWNYAAIKRSRRIRRWVRNGFMSPSRE